MGLRALAGLLFFAAALFAQPACPAAPAYTPCDLIFELAAGEDANRTQLHAEFRSPRHKTYLMPAFRDGARLVIRFTPVEPGDWVYRLTSSVERWNGKQGQFTAGPSDSPGFIRPRNVHHWVADNGKAHLWMGADGNAASRAEFEKLLDARASEKFTHLRVSIPANADLAEIDARVAAIHRRGLITDLVLEGLPQDRIERETWMKEIVPRYAAFNVVWFGPEFEKIPDAKPMMRDFGAQLKKLDPYQHPRGALSASTSAALFGDQWVNFRTYGTIDEHLGSVEHQLYQLPAINTAISGVNDLWRATMNGQYPSAGAGKHMTIWFDFIAGTRYWELEPHFDVDGGRALALEGIEYVVWVEKPGPIEVTVERHGYDVAWFNPLTGERLAQKDFKGETFTGEPPSREHPWVLHISREGRKQGMLNSYKFESREVPLVQEVEQSPQKIPFEIASPASNTISLSAPPPFAIKIKRDTRATRTMMILWIGEVVTDGQGFRVLGTGREGTMRIPSGIAKNLPAVLSVRVAALNANGKAYIADRVYKLVP